MDTRYEEALERAKSLYGNSISDNAILEHIFPQLAESEDERIRKELIGGLMWQRDNLNANGRHDDNLILPGFTMRVGDLLAYLEKLKERKPAEWSEEDKEWIAYFERLLEFAYNKDPRDLGSCCVAGKMWLKSLRPYSKIEWTEEDDEKRNRAISYLSDWIQDHIIDKEGVKDVEAIKSWLSKLAGRPCDSCWRLHWKPSEEQMEALDKALDYLPEGDMYDWVSDLYYNLKAL